MAEALRTARARIERLEKEQHQLSEQRRLSEVQAASAAPLDQESIRMLAAHLHALASPAAAQLTSPGLISPSADVVVPPLKAEQSEQAHHEAAGTLSDGGGEAVDVSAGGSPRPSKQNKRPPDCRAEDITDAVDAATEAKLAEERQAASDADERSAVLQRELHEQKATPLRTFEERRVQLAALEVQIDALEFSLLGADYPQGAEQADTGGQGNGHGAGRSGMIGGGLFGMADTEPSVTNLETSLRAADCAIKELNEDSRSRLAALEQPKKERELLGEKSAAASDLAADFTAIAQHAADQAEMALKDLDEIPGVVLATPLTAHTHFASLWNDSNWMPEKFDVRAHPSPP